MGQRQNKTEIEYGDDCEACTPELWLADKTPKHVYARFSQVLPCRDLWCATQPSPPNDRAFKLTQHSTSPCTWIYTSTQWRIEYYLNTTVYHRSILKLMSLLPVYYYLIFYSETSNDNPCVDFFHNQLRCSDLYNCGHGGIGIVTWRTETIDILNLLNMKGMSDIFMEMRPLVDGNRIYKFCRKTDATNIAIEYEPD